MKQYQVYVFEKEAVTKFEEDYNIYDTSAFDKPQLAESLSKYGKCIKETDSMNEAQSVCEKNTDANQISMVWDMKNEEWFA